MDDRSESPYQVAAWYDPRLPAPDSDVPLYQGQNRVRRLNGPKRNAANDQDYAEYYDLYGRYLKWRLPFLHKPDCIPVSANGPIPAWDKALAQKLRELGNNAAHPEYVALQRNTNQVVADYVFMWNQLQRVIDELAECNYVHNFGGAAHTRIIDTDRGVDVTAAVPLRGWAPIQYDATGDGYDVATQMRYNGQGVAVAAYETHYSEQRPPLPRGGTLVIFKDPATTQRYRSLLWAAVKGQ